MAAKLRELVLAALALAAVNLVVIDALGQGPEQGPGKGPPRGKAKKGPPLIKEEPSFRLLSLKPVQKELELSDKQSSQFHAIGPELKSKVEELTGQVDEAGLTPPQRKELEHQLKPRERELHAWVREQIDALLSPAQKRRLRELKLQVEGAKALGGPGMARELNLSESQLAEMETIRQQERLLREEARRQFPGGKENGELRKEKEDLIRSETEQRLLGVLSKEQRKTWEKMAGEPFDVSLLKPPPPMPPKGAKKPPKDGPKPPKDPKKPPKGEKKKSPKDAPPEDVPSVD